MIKTNSPTRVDLAGGTIDCWPLYLLFKNCQTVNLAIDINTGVELEPRTDSSVGIHVMDFNYEREFSNIDEALDCDDKELTLLRPHLNYWRPAKGFHLKSFSESPVGGGLGGSSSLCVSLLKAFSQWLERPLSVQKMVDIASHLEIQIIQGPGGTQDYYPPILGGLNVIHYEVGGPRVEALESSFTELAPNIMVIYTGRAHHSGFNNWQVIKAAIDKDADTLKGLENIADIARDMAEVCREANWSRIPDLFQAEYAARTALSPAFTSPEIETLNKVVLQAGAEAVKICGAGGGGCVLLWVPPEKQDEVRAACQKNGFQPLDAKPVGPLAKAD